MDYETRKKIAIATIAFAIVNTVPAYSMFTEPCFQSDDSYIEIENNEENIYFGFDDISSLSTVYHIELDNENLDYMSKEEVQRAVELYNEIYGTEFTDTSLYNYFFSFIYDTGFVLKSTPIFSISKESIVATFYEKNDIVKVQSFNNMKDRVFFSVCSPNYKIRAMDCKIDNISFINSFIKNV